MRGLEIYAADSARPCCAPIGCAPLFSGAWPAEQLDRGLGYIAAGVILCYALPPAGGLADTAIL
jgi:hypothetical protein